MLEIGYTLASSNNMNGQLDVACEKSSHFQNLTQVKVNALMKVA